MIGNLPDSISPPNVDQPLGSFQTKSDPVLHAPTPFVCPCVANIRQELLNQIAISGMKFNAIESSELGHLRGFRVLVEDVCRVRDRGGIGNVSRLSRKCAELVRY